MGREIEVYCPRTDGGWGDGAPSVRPSDARLMGRAVKGRWPLSEDERREVLETLLTVVRQPHHFDPRTVVAAGKALIDADKVNLDDEARRTPRPQLVQEPDGRTRVRFDQLSDDELNRFIEEPA